MSLIGLNLSLKPNNSDLGAFLFYSNVVFFDLGHNLRDWQLYFNCAYL